MEPPIAAPGLCVISVVSIIHLSVTSLITSWIVSGLSVFVAELEQNFVAGPERSLMRECLKVGSKTLGATSLLRSTQEMGFLPYGVSTGLIPTTL
jgi:hypothetical protein